MNEEVLDVAEISETFSFLSSESLGSTSRDFRETLLKDAADERARWLLLLGDNFFFFGL